MTLRFARLAALVAGLSVAVAVHAGDCYNDDVPASNDLEPPVPGSTADLLRITDDDLARMLEAIRAHELASSATRGDAPQDAVRTAR